MIYAKQTALFLRVLAESVCPQNKIAEIVHDVSCRASWIAAHANDAAWQQDADFTERERHMAASLGPTNDEVDAWALKRIAEYKTIAEKEQSSARAAHAMLRATDAKVRGLEGEVRALREALEALGIDPGDGPT